MIRGRARAEEGAPEFDLDWELAREVERDNARGLVEGLEAAGLLPAARTAEDGDARAVREEMEELGLMSAARTGAGEDGVRLAKLRDGSRSARSAEEARSVLRTAGVIGRSLTNASLGLTVVISNRDVAKMTSEKAVKKSVSPRLHTLAVANADKVFEAAFVDGTHADTHGRKEVRRTHRLGSAVYDPVSERFEPVLVTVLEYVKDGTKMYTVEAIDVAKYENSAGQLAAVTVGERQAPIAEFVRSIANRVAEVNGGEAKFAAGREYDEVVARYTNADGTRKPGWMKAPNGRPTNLAERQWVQAHTPAFKRWFGDWENDPANASKVVDANGEPLVVYRGASFDPLAQNPGEGVIMGGAYFSPHPEYARRYGNVRAYYLNIRRPFDIRNRACLEDLKKVYPDHEFATGPSGALDWGEATAVDEEFLTDNFGEKYDGLVYDEGGDGESAHGGMRHRGISYVPAEGGAQVKSATDNAGAFDAGNPDVRFHVGRVNPDEKMEMRARLASWLDPKTLATARGLSRDEIFSKFGNALEPVSVIPIEYARLLDESIADNRVYSGRGYMVDHVANHHPESDPTAYLNIQEIIDSPDDVKIDDRNPSRNKSLLFIKNVGASGVVIVSFGEGKDGKILLHKSFFDRVKKGRFDKYQSVKLSSVVGNPTISHAGKPAPAVRLSALEDTDSVPQSGGVAQGGVAKFAVGKLYTGSAADYERPSLHFVGTGEGSQVYGWGLYASDVRGIAEEYADMGREYNAFKNGVKVDLIFPQDQLVAATAKALMKHGGSVEETIADLKRQGIGSAVVKELEAHGSEYKVAKSAHVYEQTFFTDRAPGDESHLLKWYEPVSEEQMGWILDALKDMGSNERILDFVNREREKDLERDGLTWRDVEGEDAAPDYYPDDVLRDYLEQYLDLAATGGEVYGQLSEALGSPKAASEFLARAGIDGVKYPADSYGGNGVKDGDEAGWNYASFRDDNIRVDHKWTDGVARFHVGSGEDAAWRRVVDEYVEGRLAKRQDAIVLPRVPVVISRVLNETLGVATEGRRVVISSDCLSKAMDGKHRIPAEEMKRLATSLDAPLAVFQSRTRPRDSVTALVPIRDQNGGISSVVPIDYTAKSADGGDVLRITSVYGKTSAEAVQSWIDQGYLLYADRKNISRSFPHRLQLPGRNKTANHFLDETDFSREALGMIANPDGNGNGGEADARLQAGEAVAMDAVEVVYDPRAQVLPGGVRVAADAGLERRIVTTVCETGSFEKAAKVCGAWGCELSDDKAMTTVRRVGDACEAAKAPGLCDCAAGKDDVLIVMMDGWMARYREAKWGRRSAPPCERVGWHEVKSAVMFRLSQVAEVSRGRRMLITKHVVAMPAGTDPVDFGRRVQGEAVRMGLNRARKVYVIMDGGVCLWGVFEDRFANVAVGQLDYYHASQHLHALAGALFPDESQERERDAWTRRLLKNLRTWGPKTLMDAIADAERTKTEDRARSETVRRESEYFRSHREHMGYRAARREGVPIGSGAMESQCSQNQNRFKRRGQFWSKAGFASFIAAYVWYTNDELDVIYSHAA